MTHPTSNERLSRRCMDFAEEAIRYVGFAAINDWDMVSEERLDEALRKALALLKSAHETSREPAASSECPICGVGTPHGHSDEQIAAWLNAQASRFGRSHLVFLAGAKGSPIKPCPYCKQAPRADGSRDCGLWSYTIRCATDSLAQSCAHRHTVWGETEDAAITKWNAYVDSCGSPAETAAERCPHGKVISDDTHQCTKCGEVESTAETSSAIPTDEQIDKFVEGLMGLFSVGDMVKTPHTMESVAREMMRNWLAGFRSETSAPNDDPISEISSCMRAIDALQTRIKQAESRIK